MNGCLISEGAVIKDTFKHWRCEENGADDNDLNGSPLMIELPEPLKPLEAWPQFVAWRIEERDGKDVKRPEIFSRPT